MMNKSFLSKKALIVDFLLWNWQNLYHLVGRSTKTPRLHKICVKFENDAYLNFGNDVFLKSNL
jgi:hypothetical protein